MASLMLIAIGSALCSNVVLSQFLGICSFLGVSKKTETAAGMGGAVVFVITIASFVAFRMVSYGASPAALDALAEAVAHATTWVSVTAWVFSCAWVMLVLLSKRM